MRRIKHHRRVVAFGTMTHDGQTAHIRNQIIVAKAHAALTRQEMVRCQTFFCGRTAGFFAGLSICGDREQRGHSGVNGGKVADGQRVFPETHFDRVAGQIPVLNEPVLVARVVAHGRRFRQSVAARLGELVAELSLPAFGQYSEGDVAFEGNAGLVRVRGGKQAKTSVGPCDVAAGWPEGIAGRTRV